MNPIRLDLNHRPVAAHANYGPSVSFISEMASEFDRLTVQGR
jgi:hypothetical protein